MSFRNRRSDFGIGASPSPNGRGRGRGTQKSRLDAPLTRLLYEDRPLLRPIVFVPSTLKPVLFDQDDDLLKPGVEEVGTFLYFYFLKMQTGELNYITTTQVILNKVISRLLPRYHGCSVAVTFKA